MIPDISTSDGLRGAFQKVVASGWDSPAGQLLDTALLGNLHRFAPLASKYGQDDTASMVFDVARTETVTIAQAESPWGYLLSYVSYRLRDMAKEEYSWVNSICVPELMDMANASTGSFYQHGPEQVYCDEEDVETIPALRQVATDLTDHGVERAVAYRAIARATTIAAQHDAKRRHSYAATDPELAALGFSPAAARALVAVISGSRRKPDAAALLPGGADYKPQLGRLLKLLDIGTTLLPIVA